MSNDALLWLYLILSDRNGSHPVSRLIQLANAGDALALAPFVEPCRDWVLMRP